MSGLPNDLRQEADGAIEARAYASEPLMQFFQFGHLPMHLREVSAPFAMLAKDIVIGLPPNQQRDIALQKLLEAKDAAVRARLFK